MCKRQEWQIRRMRQWHKEIMREWENERNIWLHNENPTRLQYTLHKNKQVYQKKNETKKEFKISFNVLRMIFNPIHFYA